MYRTTNKYGYCINVKAMFLSSFNDSHRLVIARDRVSYLYTRYLQLRSIHDLPSTHEETCSRIKALIKFISCGFLYINRFVVSYRDTQRIEGVPNKNLRYNVSKY